MESRRSLELRMSYIKEQMKKLPHGSFGSVRGRATVKISYDPFDPSVTTYNYRRYYIDSPKGRFYSPLIKEYLRYAAELKRLEAEWNIIYKIPPRNISYPLKKRRHTIFDGDFFEKAESNMNSRRIENPIPYKGMTLRSKNELIGVQILEKFGLEYKVEPKVGDGFDQLYPDLIFNIPEQCRCAGIEIDGAIDKEQYAYKSRNRRIGYLNMDLMPGKDIIFLDIASPADFYAELFETMAKLAIEAGLDDICFPGDQ